MSYIFSISYPDSPPEVYVSANDLTRSAQDLLNSTLQDYMASVLVPGECCLLLVVDWVREHAHSFFPPEEKQQLELEWELSSCGSDSHFCRMWFYMHHIYSKTKRRNILALADDKQLSGFCLPVKGSSHWSFLVQSFRICFYTRPVCPAMLGLPGRPSHV